MAERILMNEFKSLSKEKWVTVELNNENVFDWNIALVIVNTESLYYGGYFKAKMTFPHNYPYSPPDFKFLRPLFHPNIYPDGKLCISILHAPGEDEMSGELAAERWSPAQRVESVLLSIISLLDDAECSSPANVDAGVLLRKDRDEFKLRVRRDVEVSKTDIPEGYIMPERDLSGYVPEKHDDRDFWYDSDGDDDFGGSDTDAEMAEDEEEDGEDADDDDEEMPDEGDKYSSSVEDIDDADDDEEGDGEN